VREEAGLVNADPRGGRRKPARKVRAWIRKGGTPAERQKRIKAAVEAFMPSKAEPACCLAAMCSTCAECPLKRKKDERS